MVTRARDPADRIFEDSIGRIYVGERACIGLRRIDAEGSVTTLPLIRGVDDEETPLGPHRQIFLTPDEVLYVSGGDRLWRARFDGDGSSLRLAEGPRIMASDFVVHGERIIAAATYCECRQHGRSRSSSIFLAGRRTCSLSPSG